jgi:hypothetical protein
MTTPPGQCPQCWQHAHDKSIHRSQDQSQDCAQCVDHMRNGCPNIVPKKKSSWF